MKRLVAVTSIAIVLGAASDGKAQTAPTTPLVVRDSNRAVVGRLASLTMDGATPTAATVVTSTGHTLTLSMATGALMPFSAPMYPHMPLKYTSSTGCNGQAYAPTAVVGPVPNVVYPGPGGKFVMLTGDPSVRISANFLLAGDHCTELAGATQEETAFPVQFPTRSEIGLPKIVPPLSIQ